MIDGKDKEVKHILVTGGAGFIGSNFVRHWLEREEAAIVNLDKLTYAGNLMNLSDVSSDEHHIFIKGDINDRQLVSKLLDEYRPFAIVHFAAETHVDRSIHGAEEFIQTNVVGTFNLLTAARHYWSDLPETQKTGFRFVHISTDEVYGSLSPDEPGFRETTPYAPNSPYAASKAAADHMVRAFHQTFGLPTLTTNCSNNYGPYQFPEKLIPLMVHHALSGLPLPVYGDGRNVRDWLYVADHCEAICTVMKAGRVGESYNIGGESEMANIDVVKCICTTLSDLRPGYDYHSLIKFVNDRPGHDRRYAMDTTKIRQELGWQPSQNFAKGLETTVRWYLENPDWVNAVTSGAYRDWIQLNYKDQSERAVRHGR
jgi:dTDP-glucose 4,6-dehydratase